MTLDDAALRIEKRYRNKDHETMMDYLRSEKHHLSAWNYHAERAADYIEKLEKKLCTLRDEAQAGQREKDVDIIDSHIVSITDEDKNEWRASGECGEDDHKGMLNWMVKTISDAIRRQQEGK